MTEQATIIYHPGGGRRLICPECGTHLPVDSETKCENCGAYLELLVETKAPAIGENDE